MNLTWLTRGAASAERSRRLMQLRGVTPNGHPLWNGQEVGDLVGDYPNYSLALIKLPRRTRPAAHSKASRLRITKPKAREWDENEIPRLRKIYPKCTRAEIEAAFPGRTYAAIAKAANARGIFRRPKPIRPTGNRLLDQILQRARERNVSMEELGLESGKLRYFVGRRWRNGRFDFSAHVRAVEYLGGAIRARWTEPPHLTVR